MDKTVNMPIWTSHYIDSELLDTVVWKKRPSGYARDPEFKTVKSNAYRSSGYDHGHLAPAADFKYSKYAYIDSHMMTNMSTQHGCFNQRGWCQLEGTVRRCNKREAKYKGAECYIVSGFVKGEYIDSLCINTTTTVYVPKSFYKVILVKLPNGKYSSIGFIMPNESMDNQDIEKYKISVDEVEAKTGLDFFSFVDDKEEKKVEKIIGNFPFYTDDTACPSKTCAGVYSSRVKPEERTKLICD